MYLNNIYTFCCSPWSSHVWPRQLEPYETNVISELLWPACGKLEQWAGFYYSDTQYIRLGFARYVLAIQGRIKLHCGTVMGGGEFWLTLPRNFTILHFEVVQETGSRWLSKCIVGLFLGTHFQQGGKFVPQNSPRMHFDNHLDPVSRTTSKWRIPNAKSYSDPKTVSLIVLFHRTPIHVMDSEWIIKCSHFGS